jgi:hypothetical protein
MVFAAIASPMIIALSLEKGRFTFGETGRLTYLRHVNNIPFPHWPADAPSEFTPPERPPRRIHDNPPVYEFGAPVPGTYPLWFDPSYWYEGAARRFDLGDQARRVAASARFYFQLFVREQGLWVAVWLVLAALTGRVRLSTTARGWPLALVGISVVAFGLYFPVYVEGRYLAPFLVLLWGGLLAPIRVDDTPAGRRALRAAGVALPILVVFQLALFDAKYLPRIRPALTGSPRPGMAGWVQPREIAATLLAAGVKPGDEIGYIGYGIGATFARLARVHITSELPSGAEAWRFWKATPETQSEVLAAFAATGAVAVVTDELPRGPAPEGWVRIGSKRGYAYRLLTGTPSRR